MSGDPSIPQRPEDVVFPHIHPRDYPPRPNLRVRHARGIFGTAAIRLRWKLKRQPRIPILTSEVYFYEHNESPYNPSLWIPYQGDILDVDISGVDIPISALNRNRRYYFTVRFVNETNIFGPYSEPVSIVV